MKKYLVCLFVLLGCNNGAETPEGLLKMFVADTVAGKVDRGYYQAYTSGELLKASEDLTDEEIENSKMPSLKKVKTKILSKNCESNRCIITYLVSYNTKSEKSDQGTSFATEIKKIAEVVKESDMWKLTSVKNIKTFHESLEPIKPLEK